MSRAMTFVAVLGDTSHPVAVAFATRYEPPCRAGGATMSDWSDARSDIRASSGQGGPAVGGWTLDRTIGPR